MNTHHDILVSMLAEHSQALALPKGRRVGQPGHDHARDYLLRQMASMRLVPFAGDSFKLSYERPHPNTRQPQRFTNLVGVIPGRNRTLPPLLIGADYDSVIDAPCVDDNATSVALSLVIAQEYVLHIEIPRHAPRPSSTGKTLTVASSNGNQITEAKVNGSPVIVGVNAYIKPA